MGIGLQPSAFIRLKFVESKRGNRVGVTREKNIGWTDAVWRPEYSSGLTEFKCSYLFCSPIKILSKFIRKKMDSSFPLQKRNRQIQKRKSCQLTPLVSISRIPKLKGILSDGRIVVNVEMQKNIMNVVKRGKRDQLRYS